MECGRNEQIKVVPDWYHRKSSAFLSFSLFLNYVSISRAFLTELLTEGSGVGGEEMRLEEGSEGGERVCLGPRTRDGQLGGGCCLAKVTSRGRKQS